VSLVYAAANAADQPGTHVLAIGVGRYPHLIGGDGETANKLLGLGQLESPPVSMKALLDWYLAPLRHEGAVGFVNADVPLASMEALASATTPVSIDTPSGAVTLDAATREHIQTAFEVWLERLQSRPDNIGVFYFCGHGLMAADRYLLAEDFGQSNAQPWANAVDLSNTIRALKREVQGSLYYFIDACQEIAADVAMTLGANPQALFAVDLNKGVICQGSVEIYAAGEGKLAHARKGGHISWFTSALLNALSGYCGGKASQQPVWTVGGEDMTRAVQEMLHYQALETDSTQVSSQVREGTPAPLLRLTTAPKVKAWLDLEPRARRMDYTLDLLHVHTDAHFCQRCLNQVFKVDVPRGYYSISAHTQNGKWPAIGPSEEEMFNCSTFCLTLHSPPS